MNKRIKKLWIAALRGGNYNQTTGTLRDDDGYCCLGVLCDVHSKETGQEWSPAGIYCHERGVLPKEVTQWAELGNDNGCVNTPGAKYADLVDANDRGEYSFEKIANVIQNKIKGK